MRSPSLLQPASLPACRQRRAMGGPAGRCGPLGPIALALLGCPIPAAASAAADGGGPPPAEAPAATAAPAGQPQLTLPLAQAMAARHHLAAVAARLQIDLAQARQLGAGQWENPTLTAAVSNFILGEPCDQQLPPEELANFHPKLLDQRNLSLELGQQLDLWRKRRAAVRVAQVQVQQSQLGLRDALRQLHFEVAEAFAQVVRGQAEVALAEQSHGTYRQTLELCRSRRRLGDISQSELDKIELEQLRYIDQDIGAQGGLQQARLRLAAALALADAQSLPTSLSLPTPEPVAIDIERLQRHALAARPDLLGAQQAAAAAQLQLAAERRERLPDLTVSLSYVNSKFQISGDNPNTLGLGLGLPLPLLARNQAGIKVAAAELALAQATAEDLGRQVRREVAAAVVSCRQAERRLSALHPQMQARAERAQQVAARAWRAGSTSLLEFLEADRTYLELQRDVLEARDDWRQASFALALATALEPEQL